ncbi:MAG: hypothetical protein GF400_03485 [Candidatus Eisenbacteria bacterium]|nr:hypothetical protein [Candidatus Eisenbacteria bacterium]
MANLWDDVKNAIVDGYVYASDKAEEFTQISRAKVEILRLNRQIARAMSEIGGRAFELFEKDEQDRLPTDEDVMEAIDAIRKMRLDIKKWEREIEVAKAERAKSEGRDDSSEQTELIEDKS